MLLARQAEIQGEIMRAKPTDFTDAPIDSIGIGSVVTLIDQANNESHKYVVLGAWDSDPDNNVLSYLTPLGQKLLGEQVGNIVETEVEGNVQSWKVEDLSRWVDSQ